MLRTSPAAQGRQSKQQIGFPFCTAFLVPGRQLALHTDTGTQGQSGVHFQPGSVMLKTSPPPIPIQPPPTVVESG